MKTALKATATTVALAAATFLLFANHFLYAWGWL
jgi:hypothetical protein